MISDSELHRNPSRGELGSGKFTPVEGRALYVASIELNGKSGCFTAPTLEELQVKIQAWLDEHGARK